MLKHTILHLHQFGVNFVTFVVKYTETNLTYIHICLFYLADNEAANNNRANNKKQEESVTNSPEHEHHDPATVISEEVQEWREQKHKDDQSLEQDNNNSVIHQQEDVTDPEGNELKQTETEDTEQVETFFSTMSHRYDNAPVESHIL